MRVRSTPHILNNWVRESNLGALRGDLFLPFHGTQNPLAGLTHHIGDHVGELDIHLCQHFLHMPRLPRLAT